jgi:hypothetical protein
MHNEEDGDSFFQKMLSDKIEGDMPLTLAVYWVMQRQNVHVDVNNDDQWKKAFEALLPKIVDGEIKLIGKSNQSDTCHPIHGCELSGLPIAFNQKDTPREFFDYGMNEESKTPCINCFEFFRFFEVGFTEEVWRKDRADSIGGAFHKLYTHLQIKKSDLAGYWPYEQLNSIKAKMLPDKEFCMSQDETTALKMLEPLVAQQKIKNDLIDQLSKGEITPEQAEIEAEKHNFSLLDNPDPQYYDPMQEAYWTYPMVLAWMVWQNIDDVRDYWNDYREKTNYWQPQTRGLPKNGIPNAEIREGYYPLKRARANYETLISEESGDKKNQKKFMHIAQAKDELLYKLKHEEISHAAINSSTKRPYIIQNYEWPYLIFVDDNMDIILTYTPHI